MTVSNRLPARFNFLTAVIWLLVAAGICLLLWRVITRISGTTLPVSTATPNQTQVYQTIAAILTAQHTNPAETATQTVTPSPTVKSSAITSIPLSSQNWTSTPGDEVPTVAPALPCNQAAAGKPLDLTIPDDSMVSPGQSFIKTWKLVNIGSCTWTTSYSASFFYGDRMDAPGSVALKETVLPEQSVEISIEMIAPQSAGTHQGNWKLSDPNGILFGIGPNGDAPFWVRITIPENPSTTAIATPGLTTTPGSTASPSPTFISSPTETSTSTSSPTQSPAPTSTSSPTEIPAPSSTITPPVQASGELSAIPGDEIDLDTLTITSNDADLSYQVDASNYHWLAPMDGAMIGVFGSLEPSLTDCQSAGMSSAPIAVESLSIGTYLCYATNQGRSGKALFNSLDPTDFTLTLELLTWALP